ncbi:hypothetical protein EZV62_002163 [Acer yangbiense]|uniref:C2H2-type domain-containing protein n=1 Tax=Acer yangbiense TaxID=1000413 RepID=A0A5C7IXD8_9ROSI|nr:hypothetical protein EZV62_002163 [Acer yangbiense]
MNFDCHTDHQTHKGGILKPTPLNAKSTSQISGRNLNLNQYHSHNLNLSSDQLSIMNLQAPSIGESNRNQMRNNTTNANQKYDGRTHSLPCKKYRPYKCPKCNMVFNSSQKFASHMLSHYRNESSSEKKRRLTARNKRKNKFQLVSSSEGFTVIPVMFINKDSTKIHAQGEDGPSSVRERFHYGLKIKEEANMLD